jgi:hypothetical protein
MATRKKRAAAKAGTAKKRSGRKPAAKKAVAKKSSARKSAAVVAAKRVAKKAAPRSRGAARPAAKKPKIAKKPSAPRAAESVKREAPARRPAASPVVDTSLFPCGDAAIRAATGKDWNEWLALLDAAGAATKGRDHQQIWDLTMQSLPEAAGWWGQMVSVGYERARGLREKHETCAGDFQSTLSKTLPVPLFAAFAAWADEGLRRNWLDAPGLDFTKVNAGKNIRARWPDGSLLDIRFNASAPDRCQVVVDTMKLANAQAVQDAKAFWQQQFERLQAYFKI